MATFTTEEQLNAVLQKSIEEYIKVEAEKMADKMVEEAVENLRRSLDKSVAEVVIRTMSYVDFASDHRGLNISVRMEK